MMSRGIKAWSAWATLSACVLVLSVLCNAQQAPESPPAHASTKHDAAYYAFRNSVDKVKDTDPSIPHFKLSADYPKKNPGKCTECAWLGIDVDFGTTLPPKNDDTSGKWQKYHWDEYVKSILDYVKQGQDPDLADKVGFRTTVDGKTRWFNVPWMAYDPTMGREFVHGTTNERTVTTPELKKPTSLRSLQPAHGIAAMAVEPTQLHADPQFRGVSRLNMANLSCDNQNGYESWSVGFYNEWGGYAVGKAFPATGRPHVVDYLGSQMPDGLPFPEGTAVVKVLTTSAPPHCVSQLKGAPEWHVNRHKFDPEKGYECEREVQVSRVVQVDAAVADHRSPTGWVYTTFAYDGRSSGATFWDRLVPVGVQFGADPWSFPAVPRQESLPLQQTVLNPGSKSIVEHYGCEGRLAGPVDNPQSSCLSCHGSAYAAPNGAPSVMPANVPPAFGFAGICVEYSLDNAFYFQNQVPPQHFAGGRFPDAFSLDTSLQLAVAFNQYGLFHTDHQPIACTNPNQLGPHAPPGGK